MTMSVTDQSRAISPLAEAQYRRDLIHSAVSEFAPHMAAHSDIRVIHLYSTNNTLRRLVRDTFKSAKTLIVEHVGPGQERAGVNAKHYSGPYLPLPRKADLVLTKSNLTSKVEWFAAQLGGAYPVVLPEGEGFVRNLLDRRQVLVLVGDDQGKA